MRFLDGACPERRSESNGNLVRSQTVRGYACATALSCRVCLRIDSFRRGKQINADLLPAEKILCVDEVADAGRLRCFLVYLLIANHGGGFEIDAVHLGQVGDHSAARFAAVASVGIVMRT